MARRRLGRVGADKCEGEVYANRLESLHGKVASFILPKLRLKGSTPSLIIYAAGIHQACYGPTWSVQLTRKERCRRDCDRVCVVDIVTICMICQRDALVCALSSGRLATCPNSTTQDLPDLYFFFFWTSSGLTGCNMIFDPFG